MTDDFDLELRDRLERLAAAAPVGGSDGLTHVASVVKPRGAAFFRPAGLLVAVAVLAVIGAAVASVGSHRPTPIPGATATSAPANQAVVSTDTDGAFALSIQATQATYAAGDPIGVEASLTYRGPNASVDICTDSNGPIMFGIREKVLGKIDLTPASRLMFGHTTLARDVPFTKRFTKSGGFPGDDPAAPSFRAFFADPILRLPAGTWHVYANAASCSPVPLKFDMTAEIELVVEANPVNTAERPPTADPAPRSDASFDPPQSNERAMASVDDGTLGLRILTPRRRIDLGDPATIFTTYSYVGRNAGVVIHHAGPPVVFHIEQLDASVVTTLAIEVLSPGCESTRLEPGDQDVAFGDVRLISGEGITDDWMARHFDGSKLRLPIGHWRITALLTASTQECVGAESKNLLHASIDIEVAPVDAGGIALLTANAAPAINDECPVNAVSGILAPNPLSGLGLIEDNGAALPVRWPIDDRAERLGDGAVLYDGIGFTFAREGQHLNLSGMVDDAGIFNMCLPVGFALEAPPT